MKSLLILSMLFFGISSVAQPGCQLFPMEKKKKKFNQSSFLNHLYVSADILGIYEKRSAEETGQRFLVTAGPGITMNFRRRWVWNMYANFNRDNSLDADKITGTWAIGLDYYLHRAYKGWGVGFTGFLGALSTRYIASVNYGLSDNKFFNRYSISAIKINGQWSFAVSAATGLKLM